MEGCTNHAVHRASVLLQQKVGIESWHLPSCCICSAYITDVDDDKLFTWRKHDNHCCSVPMSWFDTVGIANLAKSALNSAQKRIDRALDIQPDEASGFSLPNGMFASVQVMLAYLLMTWFGVGFMQGKISIDSGCSRMAWRDLFQCLQKANFAVDAKFILVQASD